MENTVLVRAYDVPDTDKKEVLRYAGVRGSAEELNVLLDECIREANGVLTYKVCYCEIPVFRNKEELELGFCKVNSRDLAKNLEVCDRAVLFAATVGVGIDRLIARYSALSPTKALIFDAIGSERIEALCDVFCQDIEREKRKKIRPRFSAGYGDLPLEFQKAIFSVLDAPRKIGLSLGEGLLMSPSKSVTAIVGIAKENF